MAVAEALDARGHAGGDTAGLLAVLLLVGGSLNGLFVRVLEAWQLHGLDSPLMGVSPFEILAIVVGARAILASAPSVQPDTHTISNRAREGLVATRARVL